MVDFCEDGPRCWCPTRLYHSTVSGIRARYCLQVFVLKCESIKIDRLKKIKNGCDFSPAQGMLLCVSCVVVHCLALFPLPFPPNRLPCDMVETLLEVKARVIRQQQERTDERIRELRRERRENIIRESVSEVRERAREEQRLRTEA